MSSKSLVYGVEGQVAWLTINRPEARNTIDADLAQELVEVCLRINQNDKIALVIITGVGDEVFCTGVLSLSADDQISEIKHPAVTVADLRCPTIAAINGDALGQGLELALACDIRVAQQGVRFGFPYITEGLMPWDGGTQRLPRLVGRGKAAEMLFTGRTINADEAYQIGLVSEVVSSNELIPKVKEMAQLMSSRSSLALRYAKEAIIKGMDLTLEQGLHLEADLYFLLQTTRDRTEGIKAFMEKRTPEFEGK